MDNQMSIGVVHIVEWLNPGDAETGESLFKELQPIGAAFDPKVEIDFHRIESAGQLLGLLLVFTDKYRTDKRTPLLHLETHGTKEDIAARGQEITWRDLAEALVPLNHATGMNLVVNLAACWGTLRHDDAATRLRASTVQGLDRPEPQGLRGRGAQSLPGVLPDDLRQAQRRCRAAGDERCRQHDRGDILERRGRTGV